MQDIINKSKINILLKQDRRIFRTSDLSILWNINNKNTLYTTIKRYVDKFILFPISKGLYSIVDPKQLDRQSIVLAAIHDYAYITTETVLVENGVIFQDIPYITCVSGLSKKSQILNIDYKVRQLKDEFLYNNVGILKNNGIAKATLERAVADMLYFNPKSHIDGANIVNWDKVKEIQNIVYKN